MDYSVIDELYDVYMNDNLDYAKDQFIGYLKKYQHRSEHSLTYILKQYIEEQTKNFSSFYASNKDKNNKVKKLVKEITSAFETFVDPVHSFILSKIYTDSDLEEMKYNHDIVHRELKPNDLFSIDLNTMEEAVNENVPFYLDAFKKVKNLIMYIKESKLLQEIYVDGSWHEMNFSELIENLYDKAKDKTAFEVTFDGVYDIEEALFDKVKENCSKVSSIEFDKYRSKLILTKQITLNYGKLIFCRNLLNFFESGIMPTNDGMIDCSVDFYDSLNLIKDFKKIYSKKYNDEEFRKAQSNFICKPEIVTTDYELKCSRATCFDNEIIIGHLLTGNCSLISSRNYEIPYLIHINIKDVNNPYSCYEIQLNLIPQADISNRLQLMRLDNYSKKGVHKNLKNKLDTTTHIHLYNQFDLIRGKQNGKFEIAYNLEDKSTKFETALATFLDILDLKPELKEELFNRTIEAINKLKTEIKTTDI